MTASSVAANVLKPGAAAPSSFVVDVASRPAMSGMTTDEGPKTSHDSARTVME